MQIKASIVKQQYVDETGYLSSDPVISNSAKDLVQNPSQSAEYRRAVNSTVTVVLSAIDANLGRPVAETEQRMHRETPVISHHDIYERNKMLKRKATVTGNRRIRRGITRKK